LIGKCFPLTNFFNDKQTQKNFIDGVQDCLEHTHLKILQNVGLSGTHSLKNSPKLSKTQDCLEHTHLKILQNVDNCSGTHSLKSDM
jgi:hypothetical protein